jgi:hypothetical protein
LRGITVTVCTATGAGAAAGAAFAPSPFWQPDSKAAVMIAATTMHRGPREESLTALPWMSDLMT